MSKEKLHALVLPYPMQGHINPMMHLCKRLSGLGVSITLVNTWENHGRIVRSRESAGLPSLREQGFDIELVGISGGEEAGESSHFGDGGDNGIQRSLVAAERMAEPFVELLERVRESVDCIISDAFLGWSQDVAERFGIPRVALWASSTAYALLNFHLPLLNEKGYAPIRDKSILEDETHKIGFIKGISELHPRDLPSILQVESAHDPGFKTRAERTRRLKDAAWVLVNTFEELERDSLAAMQEEIGKFVPVGPLLPRALLGLHDFGNGTGLWLEDNRCMEFLDKQTPSSVLYISFGSLAAVSAAQMEHLVRGIESSRQPFLWVIRPESVTTEFAGFVERTKDRGLVVAWAPQLQVLFHPSVGGFLSHCGWNSTLESISMGVPIIGLPFLAEQNLNCKHAVDWKLGWRLKKNRDGIVESEEIEGVVTRFTTGQEGMDLRIRARELREAATRSVMEDGSSRKNLEAVVEALKNNCLKT